MRQPDSHLNLDKSTEVSGFQFGIDAPFWLGVSFMNPSLSEANASCQWLPVEAELIMQWQIPSGIWCGFHQPPQYVETATAVYVKWDRVRNEWYQSDDTDAIFAKACPDCLAKILPF